MTIYQKEGKPVKNRFQFSDFSKESVYTKWRLLAGYYELSQEAKQRLEWLIFYYTVGRKDVKYTSSYFGISRKTFHKWKKRFDSFRIASLEEHSRSPNKKRTWTVTEEEEKRIINLRTKYIKYGKKKLKVLYRRHYHEVISTWKIERVVRKHNLYPPDVEYGKRIKRNRNRKKKLRIHELTPKPVAGRLWHTDTVILYWYEQRRVIFTAIEDKTKIAYARVYETGSSRQATDFLQRLIYLSNSDIKIIHSDNGSEFAGEFEKACLKLGIQQVYNRVRTPKDNPVLERFNWTIQDEWLSRSEAGLDDVQEGNNDLTEWLIEYNNVRPHESLDYLTPLEYAQKYYSNVLPMTPASTKICSIVV